MTPRPDSARPLRACHVGVLPDPLEREPDALLDAWFTLAYTATAAARAGADVTVVQAAARDADHVRDGVPYRFVRTPPRGGVRRRLGYWATPVASRLVDAVRAARPDVIHFHGLGFPRHVGALTRALPATPVLLQDHADAPPGRWTRAIHRRGLARVGALIVTAPEHARAFVEAGIVRPSVRVFVVPECSSRFAPGDRAAARSATGIAGDPALLWLGNLDHNKDPLTVLDGLARAVPELPDVRLWCCFRGDELRGEVERRIGSDPALAGRVHLLGSQPHARVEQLLRAADFLVQASHREGSGYALIEALACGCAPIVTDIPSFRVLTGQGRVGALFPPGDAGAFADALVRLARRDRGALRREVRDHFERTSSFDVVGRDLVAAYRAVAEARA